MQVFRISTRYYLTPYIPTKVGREFQPGTSVPDGSSGRTIADF